MAKQQFLPKLSDEEFLDAVHDCYNRIIKKEPEGTNVPDEVKKVVYPLATLGDALDLLAENLKEKPDPDKLRRTAFIATLDLFDTLMSGAAHPFWRYADALRKQTSHRPPPSKVETAKRTIAVGCLRAVMQILGPRSQSKAAIKIETECLSHGMKLTVRQLDEWNTYFLTERKDDPEPDRVAARLRTIEGRPSNDVQRIISKGVNNMALFFTLPKR